MRLRQLDVTVRDAPLALLMFVAALVPGFAGYGTRIGDVADRPLDGLGVLVVALETLPLVVRRRAPALCLGLVSVAFVGDQLLGYHTLGGTAWAFALFSAGAHLEHRRWVVVGPVVAVCALVAQGEPPADLVVFCVVCAGIWGSGSWLRSTRAAEAEHRLRVAETARTAERTRIARELHDVVTHHVTAMVVQTEAARYLTGTPDRLDAALAGVTDTGRRAITDLRHLLDLLNPDHGLDVPPVGDLGTLVEQTRAAGQPIEFTENGRPATTSGSAELVAFRVVQEALTNALKHDHGGHTVVLLEHSAREIVVQVGTDGTGTDAGAPHGSGRGLMGLRERVDVLGGEFDAGPRDGGGFLVTARIPAGGRS